MSVRRMPYPPMTFYALFADGEIMPTTNAGSIWDVVAEAGRQKGAAPRAVLWWETDDQDEIEILGRREDDLMFRVRAERMDDGERSYWAVLWELFYQLPEEAIDLASGETDVFPERPLVRYVMWWTALSLALGDPKSWQRGESPFPPDGEQG